MDYKKHLIKEKKTIKEALELLSNVGVDTILFTVDESEKLIGSVTDGDIRRGLLKGISIEDEVLNVTNKKSKYLEKSSYSINQIIELRKGNYELIPVIDNNRNIQNILNFREMESYLPIDAVIMAGGLGSRLRPLTNNVPKPLLKIGDKAIIDYNLDRLRKYGVDDFWISVRYLGEQIEEHLGNGSSRNISIEYVYERNPLGTIGAVSNIKNFKHDYVLVTNSDILTNLDYEDFFLDFIEKDADMSVLTIPYDVDIPYAVMETENNRVLSFKEKPTYTYFSNGGIYLIKRSILDKIPENKFFNSTDLMEQLIKEDLKLISYPTRQYWLDIGKHKDFEKAQEDVKRIKF
ncbi:CBS domain protein [Tenacibaculum skagerrakense]|uniref:CBS domain protein n=1 Tax=Tenacibaculum skagerrakense TaxID=186571 RepID=A0A4R2NNQ9_9FLAO|nr:nucleotidyltransferase family protein [Tenacibaculum skagerrakense]TCP22915.1 CBS domain protein [Tenacibaculum skagerrakense]